MKDIVLKDIKRIKSTSGEYSTDGVWAEIIFKQGVFLIRHKISLAFTITLFPNEVSMIEFANGNIHYASGYLGDGPYVWWRFT